MLHVLAYADAQDTSLATMRLLLYVMLWIAAIVGLAHVPHS